MNNKERGFLLLTGQLGNPNRKPLTVAQFRRLTTFARNMEKPTESRDLTCEDLMQLGYDRQWADHILRLLNREEQLEYYVNQAGGYTADAKKSKVYAVHANGEVEKVRKYSRSIYPGSEIVVSAKKKREGGLTAAQLVSLGSATTSLATVVLALMNVLK